MELCVELYEVLNGIICFKSSKAPKSYLFDMPVYMWWLSWNLPTNATERNLFESHMVAYIWEAVLKWRGNIGGGNTPIYCNAWD